MPSSDYYGGIRKEILCRKKIASDIQIDTGFFHNQNSGQPPLMLIHYSCFRAALSRVE